MGTEVDHHLLNCSKPVHPVTAPDPNGVNQNPPFIRRRWLQLAMRKLCTRRDRQWLARRIALERPG